MGDTSLDDSYEQELIRRAQDWCRGWVQEWVEGEDIPEFDAETVSSYGTVCENMADWLHRGIELGIELAQQDPSLASALASAIAEDRRHGIEQARARWEKAGSKPHALWAQRFQRNQEPPRIEDLFLEAMRSPQK